MENTIRALIKYQTVPLTSGQHLRPWFYGPTGCGKTSRVEQMAKEMGRPIRRLLLGSMLPEDVLGLPQVMDGITRITVPDWAAELRTTAGIVLLDELDKARPECHATVLTLLAENRVRDTVLHPETIYVAASQPQPADMWLGDETGRALTARLICLPMAYDWKWLSGRTGTDLSAMPAKAALEPIRLPEPSPRQVEWFIGFARWDRNAAAEVAPLLFHPDTASYLMGQIESTFSLSATDIEGIIKESPEAAAKMVEKLNLSELTICADILWKWSPPQTIARMLERVWLEGTREEIHAFAKAQFEQLKAAIKASDSKSIDIGRGCTEEEMVKVLAEKKKEIDKELERRKEAGKKEMAKGKKAKNHG